MKSSFEYSFHQHHHQLHHPIPQQADQVLDLSSKRRDSTETRKTTSPSSFEDGSPDMRNSPNSSNPAVQLLLQHQRSINVPKPPFTPEHSIQYHYNYDQTSPTSNQLRNVPLLPTPEIFERFNNSQMIRKQENVSPQPEQKRSSPPFFQMRPNEHHAEDSNDLPCTTSNISNISSSSSTTSSQKSPSSMMVVGRDGKLSRPFKAYPRDPLSLAAAGSLLDSSSAEKYSVFRKRMLEQIHAANGGNPVINNPKMRRIATKSTSQETNNNEISYDSCSEKISVQQNSPSSGNDKDEAYFERRKKNNAAAKKSRDRRRIKEDEIAIRAAFLERENIELKFELAAARKQLTLYTSGLTSS
jgi:protein giant